MTQPVPDHRVTFFAIPPGLVVTETPAPHLILERAKERAPTTQPRYAGHVTPHEAWELVSWDAAVLVDVRTVEERQYVGRIPDSVHVPWLIGADQQRNPRFVRELQLKVRRDDVVLLLCRCGTRSVPAAQALAEAGFRNAFTVLQGFEGELDDVHQRGNRGGWRYHRLPWTQD